MLIGGLKRLFSILAGLVLRLGNVNSKIAGQFLPWVFAVVLPFMSSQGPKLQTCLQWFSAWNKRRRLPTH